MLIVQEKRVKVGDYYLPGEVQAVRVSEAGKLEDKKKGKKKLSNQPTGYEPATVDIDMIFEESEEYDVENMVRLVQRLFKSAGQKKQKKYRIICPLVNAHGVTEAYFNGFSTNASGSQSWVTGTLSFTAPAIEGLSIVRTKQQIAAGIPAEGTAKTTKSTAKSPAKKKKSKSTAKKKAKKLVKK